MTKPRLTVVNGRNSRDPRLTWARRLRDGYRPTVRAELEDDTPPKLYLYDPVDPYFGVTATDFVTALGSLGDVDRLELHVNSPGGDVFDGLAITNSLRQHPAHVTAVIDGLAASVASVIAVGGADDVVMAPNAEMMIHDAWGLTVGPAETHREAADRLDMHSDNIASIYADKAQGDTADWRARMRAETWYVGSEAVDAGLADRLGLELEDDAGDGAAAAILPRSRPAARLVAVRSPVTPDGLETFDASAIPSNAARRGRS